MRRTSYYFGPIRQFFLQWFGLCRPVFRHKVCGQFKLKAYDILLFVVGIIKFTLGPSGSGLDLQYGLDLSLSLNIRASNLNDQLIWKSKRFGFRAGIIKVCSWKSGLWLNLLHGLRLRFDPTIRASYFKAQLIWKSMRFGSLARPEVLDCPIDLRA